MEGFLDTARRSLSAAARTRGTLNTYVRNFGNLLHWISTARLNGASVSPAESLMGDPSLERLRERLRRFAAWEAARGLTGSSIKNVIMGVWAILGILHPSVRASEAPTDKELGRIFAASNKHNPSSRRPYLPWDKWVIESLYKCTTQVDERGTPRYGVYTFLRSSAVWIEFLLAARPGAMVPPSEAPFPVLYFDSAIRDVSSGKEKKYIALIGADGGAKTRKYGGADLVEPPLPKILWRAWRRLISVSLWGRVIHSRDLEELDIFGERPGSQIDIERRAHTPIFVYKRRVITQNKVTSFLRKALMDCHGFSEQQAYSFSLRGGRTGCCSYLRSLGWSLSEIARVCNHKVTTTTGVYLKTAGGKKMRGIRRLKKKGAAGQDWLTKWSVDYPKRPLPSSLREAIQWMCEGAKELSAEKRGNLIAQRTRRPINLMQYDIFQSLRDDRVGLLEYPFCYQGDSKIMCTISG